MKYMGSKARHAKEILNVILNEVNNNSTKYTSWVEPFVGGANMIDKVPSKYIRYGNDINSDLIFLFQSIQDGSYTPPDELSEEEYKEARNQNVNPAHRAFVGIGCSYSGKWFGGYARGNNSKGQPRNYCLESKNNLLSQNIENVIFTSKDYQLMKIPYHSIIYCDPPYSGTTKYKDDFDHSIFWKWCEEQTKKENLVFVSEYHAPNNWECIWEKKVNNTLVKETGSKQGVERLFKFVDRKLELDNALNKE